MPPGRAVSAIRLSVLTDNTTSPDRQREANADAIAYFNLAQVGEAVDLDVSAIKTTPFERPALSKWLLEPDGFDAIVWMRIDRAVRRMTDMSALVAWAKQHKKRLIFAQGPGGGPMELDLSGNSPIAELIVLIFAFAAQMEGSAITERVIGAHAAIRTTQLRWGGGPPPYGYKAVERTNAPGWTLVPNEEEVEVLRDAVRMIREGKSLSATCVELNAQGRVPNRTRRSKKWHSGVLKNILRSPALIGYKVTGPTGKHVLHRDDDGRPIRSTETPAMTRDEWDAIQMLLDERSRQRTAPRRDTNSLLFGVLFCDGCGDKLYFNRGNADRGGKTADVYSCRTFTSKGDKCPQSVSIKAEWADLWVTEQFLSRVGAAETRETIHHAGSDPRPEIDSTTQELDIMASQLAKARSDAERALWQRRIDGLSRRIAELSALPVTEAWTESRPTGRTVADVWAEATTADRREMLREAGARVVVTKRGRGGRVSYERAAERMTMTLTGEWSEIEDALEHARQDAE